MLDVFFHSNKVLYQFGLFPIQWNHKRYLNFETDYSSFIYFIEYTSVVDNLYIIFCLLAMASLDTLSSTQVRVGKGMITTRNFHYADIVKATENFSDKYLIDGKGVQSSMYRVTLNHTTFAAKVFVSRNASVFHIF